MNQDQLKKKAIERLVVDSVEQLGHEDGTQNNLSESRGIKGDKLEPGDTFAKHYEIILFIARGGMGDVYKAKDLRLNREVALKLLLLDLSNEAFLRFQAEAKNLAKLTAHCRGLRI